MSNLIKHAKVEFLKLGYIPVEEDEEESPNKWMQESVLELLDVFSKQGHSGFSALYTVNCFKKLASYEPLSPITGEDDEWNDVSYGSDVKMFQNKRCSTLFKNGENGDPYCIEAIIWRGQDGLTFSGRAFDALGNAYQSSQNVYLPFTPKTFYVDVIEKEITKDDYESHIKDMTQLDEVFKYYRREK